MSTNAASQRYLEAPKFTSYKGERTVCTSASYTHCCLAIIKRHCLPFSPVISIILLTTSTRCSSRCILALIPAAPATPLGAIRSCWGCFPRSQRTGTTTPGGGLRHTRRHLALTCWRCPILVPLVVCHSMCSVSCDVRWTACMPSRSNAAAITCSCKTDA